MSKKKLKAVQQSEIVAINQDPMISMIERMVMNPDVDVNKMQQIIDMKHNEEDREAEKEYTKAMVRTQQGLRAVTKDRFNGQTKSNYASLEAMAKAVVPAYTAEGLAVSYGEGVPRNPDQIRVTCKVMHEAGHSESFFYDCPIDDEGIAGKKNKTATHGKASGVSYGQKYLLKMVFNVTIQDEDDDGNAAGTQPVPRISEDQVLTIHSMITENEIDMDAVLAWLNTSLKCNGLEDININAYEGVINKVKATIKNKKQREDNATD